MDAEEPLRLSVERARDLCHDGLRQLGVPDIEAATTTQVLLEASLRGVDSHGLALLPVFAERIRSGQIHPGRSPRVVQESPTMALLDGQHGMGPVLARQAVALAAQKARAAGLGAVSLRDGNYVGALGAYLEEPARQGFLVLAAANATPRVAPHGGREGLHGTNPLAWAAPGDEGEPILFDAATGHAAARIVQAAEEGASIPAGIALDRDGAPTTDPEAARQGTLLPVGGALGYGFGLLVDVLTGGLAAAPVGREVPPVSALHGPYGCSFFVLALDPAGLGGEAALRRAVDSLRRQVGASTPAAGSDGVRLPGERAGRLRLERLTTGIPVPLRRWRAWRQRLAECAVTWPERP
jgi:ureidoglycolate dehydrogenase (NAD+)